MLEVKEKIRGSLIGGAIGDALGYQIEFERSPFRRKITDFGGKIGRISDDTQMTLFTAVALLYRETRFAIRGIALMPTEAVYLGYLDWLSTQERTDRTEKISWITTIKELNTLRDPGHTCLAALESGKTGKIRTPLNNSKGSGGIMRLSPIGLYLAPSYYGKSVGEIGAEVCAITHGHPLAILSAFVLSEIIYQLTNSDISIESATLEALSRMKKWKYYDATKDRDTAIFPTEKQELENILKSSLALAKSDLTDEAAIKTLGEGWVAEEALAIAIFAAKRYETDFEKAVLAAVNHDGDSDTTGAILGNILGLKLGYTKIPEKFTKNLELSDLILNIADDLASGVPTEENGEITDELWLSRYLWAKNPQTPQN